MLFPPARFPPLHPPFSASPLQMEAGRGGNLPGGTQHGGLFGAAGGAVLLGANTRQARAWPRAAAFGSRMPLRRLTKPPLCPPHGQRHPRRMGYHAPPRVPPPYFGGDRHCVRHAHPRENRPLCAFAPRQRGAARCLGTGGRRSRAGPPAQDGRGSFPSPDTGLPLLFRARFASPPMRGAALLAWCCSPRSWPRLLCMAALPRIAATPLAPFAADAAPVPDGTAASWLRHSRPTNSVLGTPNPKT
jgi:hypothetical protein